MEKEELMQPRKVRLTPATRPMAVQAIYSAPDGYYFEPPKEPTRSLDQNAKLHAMCGDIAKQMPWMGRKLSTDDWKRLLVDAWMRETGRHGPELISIYPGGHVGIATASPNGRVGLRRQERRTDPPMANSPQQARPVAGKLCRFGARHGQANPAPGPSA